MIDVIFWWINKGNTHTKLTVSFHREIDLHIKYVMIYSICNKYESLNPKETDECDTTNSYSK